MLAKRINYLGGVPTTKPGPIKTGGTLKKMITDDLDGEYTAIRTYKGHIELCDKPGDSTTRLMLEQILTTRKITLILGRLFSLKDLSKQVSCFCKSSTSPFLFNI